MKTKKLIPIYILILFISLVLYTIFAIKPLGKEYQFSPVWKINTSNPSIKNVPEGTKKFYFNLNKSVGYFTEDGDITLYEKYPVKAAISDNYYAIYDNYATDVPFFNNKGEKVANIEASGFPFFQDDLIFVFLPGGSGFAKCNEKGEVDWSFVGTLPITAFSAKKNYTAVGFANGFIKIFNTATGALQLTYAPGGSDYPVILGLDISDDGQYIASISGHNEQRFVLSRREGNQQKIIYHTFIDSDLPYRTLVHFCEDNNRVLYNYEGHLGIFDIEKEENTVLPMKNKIVEIEETDDLTYLLGKGNKKDAKGNKEYSVYIVERTNALEGQFSFNAQNAFIKTEGDNLYVGKDHFISKLTVTKE